LVNSESGGLSTAFTDDRLADDVEEDEDEDEENEEDEEDEENEELEDIVLCFARSYMLEWQLTCTRELFELPKKSSSSTVFTV
jgi:TATA-binding protein-associated factor Taf7